ncbi:serine/threonine-protein kinase [Streptomyces sp. NPDC059900]|uniref:serine/threonine-protein kinase n=1 Tax=Streptomyces sp. NPDC059900 TaxID=3155816 RepID=UPI00341CF560
MVGVGDLLDGRYGLDSLLGQGGFGSVWQAHDTRINRSVAVKTGRPDTPQAALRFVREAELAGSLAHPNIATVHDFGQVDWDGAPLVYLVMELVPGTDLAGLIARGLPPFEVSIGWALQICAALAAAHDAGIVHRDIKPANVVVTAQATVKVLDFGIAKRQDSLTALTGQNAIIGSMPYMAPERWQGGPLDARSDLYALGCLLMELWTGRPPFPGQDMYELMGQHQGMTPPPPRSFRPELPPAADRLVLDLLAKDPARRPADARAVARQLESLAVQAPGAPHPVLPAPDPAPHPPTVPDHRVDPVRARLRRRLDQITALPADGDSREYLGLLDELIPEAARELGPDDPLTAEAGLRRALHTFASDPHDPALEQIHAKLLRVFGPGDPRTIEARLTYLGYLAHQGRANPRPLLAELEALVEQSGRIRGPYDAVTLHGRIDLAHARLREFTGGFAIRASHPVTDSLAARRRALLEPLLADLLQGLDERDQARRDVLRLLAEDAYHQKDFEAAARFYDALLPRLNTVPRAALEPGAAVSHAHSVGEAGDPERALQMLDAVARTAPIDSGYTDPLSERIHSLRSRFTRQARRTLRNTPGRRRPWFGR